MYVCFEVKEVKALLIDVQASQAGQAGFGRMRQVVSKAEGLGIQYNNNKGSL